jgi:hypothetical protein
LSECVAVVSLELDSVLRDGAARAARAFELLGEVFQELRVSRQALHHRDGLAPATSLLDPESCRHAFWHWVR